MHLDAQLAGALANNSKSEALGLLEAAGVVNSEKFLRMKFGIVEF